MKKVKEPEFLKKITEAKSLRLQVSESINEDESVNEDAEPMLESTLKADVTDRILEADITVGKANNANEETILESSANIESETKLLS